MDYVNVLSRYFSLQNWRGEFCDDYDDGTISLSNVTVPCCT